MTMTGDRDFELQWRVVPHYTDQDKSLHAAGILSHLIKRPETCHWPHILCHRRPHLIRKDRSFPPKQGPLHR